MMMIMMADDHDDDAGDDAGHDRADALRRE
jgi:hypothetical protein